jgi:hypothetical protein
MTKSLRLSSYIVHRSASIRINGSDARGASLPASESRFGCRKGPARPRKQVPSRVAIIQAIGKCFFYAQSEVNVADPAREDVSDGGGLGRGAAANPWR